MYITRAVGAGPGVVVVGKAAIGTTLPADIAGKEAIGDKIACRGPFGLRQG